MDIGKVCPNCGKRDWKEETIFTTINPNGEFVKGYGHRSVASNIGRKDYYCIACGWKDGGNPVIVDMEGNIIGKIEVKEQGGGSARVV